MRSVDSGVLIDEGPHGVVVVRSASALERLDAAGDELGRWRRVEEAPDRERDAQVVDHRSPPVQRCPAHRDRCAPGDGVVDALGVGQHQLRAQARTPSRSA